MFPNHRNDLKNLKSALGCTTENFKVLLFMEHILKVGPETRDTTGGNQEPRPGTYVIFGTRDPNGGKQDPRPRTLIERGTQDPGTQDQRLRKHVVDLKSEHTTNISSSKTKDLKVRISKNSFF